MTEDFVTFSKKSILSVLHNIKEDENLISVLNTLIHDSSFISFSAFHGIRPYIYLFAKQNDVNINETSFGIFSLEQAFYSLKTISESSRLIKLFEYKNITVLPYKGNLFINELYNNNQNREAGDVDLLFKSKDIISALNILLKEGYEFVLLTNPKKTKDIFIEELVNSKGVYEISMLKDGISLDIHWHIYYDFLPYKVDYLAFFENCNLKKFGNIEVALPNTETIFWMIITHNGGKDLWLHLKNLLDLKAFLDLHGDSIEWELIIIKSKTYKLYKIMVLGFYLLNKHFNIKSPDSITNEFQTLDYRVPILIEKYWLRAKNWSDPISRIKYERIFCLAQDEDFSIRNYFSAIFSVYSVPNLLESKRILTFRKEWKVLNFISKLVTYCIKKVF